MVGPLGDRHPELPQVAAQRVDPCRTRAQVSLPDPVKADGNEAQKQLAFALSFKYMTNRISVLVNLPIRSIDHLSLQKHLNVIGETHPRNA